MKLNAKGREKANANKMVRLFFLRNVISGSRRCLAFATAVLMACLRIVPRCAAFGGAVRFLALA